MKDTDSLRLVAALLILVAGCAAPPPAAPGPGAAPAAVETTAPEAAEVPLPPRAAQMLSNPEAAFADAFAFLPKVTRETYPDADTVLVYDWYSTTYEPDGTYVETTVALEKILTERGLQSSRTASFWNNDFYGSMTVTAARVVSPGSAEGVLSVREIDLSKNFAEAIDTSSLSANIHDPNDKNLVLSLPDLRIGDAVEIRTRREIRRPRVKDSFSDYFVFEGSAPELWQGCEITAPAARPLRSRVTRDAQFADVRHAVVTNGNGTIRERWAACDVPRYYAEPDMPAAYTCTAHTIVSTTADWRELSRWYAALSAPRLASTNEAMRAKVDEIVRGKTDRTAAIRALFDFVSRDVRYMGVMAENEAPGYEPHDVSLTFEKRSGVCRDKAALLVAMLRMAGIEAWPVLINVGPKKDADVPQAWFNHAIVAAWGDAEVPARPDQLPPGSAPAPELVLMDPTNESTASLLPEYLAEKSYLICCEEGAMLRETPPLPAEKNLARVRTEASLAANGTLAATTTISFDGINDTQYRGFFAQSSKENKRKFFARALEGAVPGAVLTGWEVRPEDLRGSPEPLEAVLRYEAPEAVRPATDGAPAPVRLPMLSDSFGIANFLLGSLGLTERRFPLEIHYPCGLADEIRLRLPQGWTLRTAPDARVETNGLFFVTSRTAETEDAGTVAVVRRDLRLLKSTFSPEEYQTLRHAQAARDRAERVPALVVGAPAHAFGTDVDRVVAAAVPPEPEDDVYLESCETELDLSNLPESWTTTSRHHLRVLTYAGQESAGDLEISYFPVIRDLVVTNAFCVAPDGTTNAVTALEEFDGDQRWVAAAPRYPAGRIRTVSFPGVAPGSEIHYTIVTRDHDRDFFSTVAVLGSLDSFGTDTFSVRGAGADAPRFEVLPPLYPQLAEAFRPEERTEPDGRRVWTVRGGGPGSAVATESRMPGATELLTTIRASEKTTAQLAADVLARVRELSDPATQTNAAAIARAIVPADASVVDKVRAVRDWSFLSLRRAGPAWQSLPLRFLTPADVTVADRYGHALDCRVAELCLLRALGLDADLLLFDSDWDPAPDPRLLATATSHTFDSVALRVRGTDGAPDLYLDGATQYARLGACAFAGRHCVDAARPDEIFVCGPALGADELLSDADRTFVTLEISEDGSALVMRSDDHLGESFDGYNRSYSRMLAEERRRSTLESAAAVAQDAELAAPLETDLDPAGPGRRTLVLRIPDFAQRVGDNLVFQMPLNLPSLSPELAPRRFPFVRADGYRATSSVRIVPPKGWRLAGIPKVSPILGLHRDGIEPEAAGARWESVLRPPRAIAATQDWTWLHRVELDPAVIPPEAFPAYRREALRTRGAAVGTVVLERIPE